jgi:hypothetical protein
MPQDAPVRPLPRPLLVSALLLALAAPAGAQVPLGGEFRVNATTAGDQSRPAVAVHRDGSFVAVWESSAGGAAPEVWGRRFDPLGNPVGGEFRVHPPSPARHQAPAVAALPRGAFAVVWEESAAGGGDRRLMGRLFDRDAQPLAPAFAVSSAAPPPAGGALDQSHGAVAADALGMVVAWEEVSERAPGLSDVFARLFDADGAPLGPDFVVHAPTGEYHSTPAVARRPNGGFVVAWASHGAGGGDLGVWVRRFNGAGAGLGAEVQVSTLPAGLAAAPALAADATGRFVAVWSGDGEPAGGVREIRGRRFAADTTPVGAEFQVNTHTAEVQDDPALAMDGNGGFAVGWRSLLQDGDLDGLFARRYASSGAPLAGEFGVNAATAGAQNEVSLGMDPGGDLVAVWRSESAEQDGSGGGIYGRRFTSPCEPGPTVLCLQGGRFKVEVAWRTPAGAADLGRTVPLTADTGTFWFFQPSNLELVVKVLDGCRVNGHYWVFAGGLTNVEVNLRVTDTLTGAERLYPNPPRTAFQPLQDTRAFATCPAPASQGAAAVRGAASAGLASVLPAVTAAAAPGPAGGAAPPVRRSLAAGTPAFGVPAAAAPAPAAGTCSPAATRLCLQDGRFAVEVDWRTPQGQEGAGKAVALTADTGYFWFFNAANVELLLKVLDGCRVNGHYWVFAGGLTNVHAEIRVTDTSTGAQHTYRNPQGTPFQPVQDTQAFPTCP